MNLLEYVVQLQFIQMVLLLNYVFVEILDDTNSCALSYTMSQGLIQNRFPSQKIKKGKKIEEIVLIQF